MKLIFCNQENPTATFVGVLPASSKDGNGHARAVYHCYGDQYFLAIVRRGAGLGGLQGAAAGDDAYGGYWFLRTGVCEMPSALRSNVLAKSAAKSIWSIKQQGEPSGSPCFSLSVNLAYFRNSCAHKQNATRYSQESGSPHCVFDASLVPETQNIR